MGFPRQEYWSRLLYPSPGDLPDSGMDPSLSFFQVDSLPSETPGKSKNTGVSSLLLFQGIFPTQELNWGLLHCRWIFYQLSYQGCVCVCVCVFSCVQLFAVSWTIAPQAPLSRGFASPWGCKRITHDLATKQQQLYIYIYIPWTEEPGGLQSMGSQRVRHE